MPLRAPLHWARGLLAVLMLLGSFVVFASEAAAIKTYRLDLKKMKGIEHGRTAVVKGEAGTQPHRFYVEGLNMNMPVTVLLRPVRAADEVALRLTKYAWNQPLREGTAKGEPLGFKFRTEGEFQLAVSSAKPATPYRLLVWVGDEVKPDLRPVVVKASEFGAKKDGFAASPVLWVIAGVLVLIAALLGVLVMRRKAS
jgi:hypothetical protein